ncbi:MAG TPA: ABC transporter ATP-binding protein [Hyphomicrobiales bacterium]|nr:ABC transporter ATP-binding protein [Hyphomicrobiales bacterium]
MNLALEGVTAGYGATEAVREVDLTVGEGEIVALIGANGAGKSTLAKTISGLLPIRAGRIRLDGAAIDGLDIAARVVRGIVHVPEGRQIFAGLAVGENLRLGGHAVPGADWRARQEEVCARFPALRGRLDEPAGNLSGGQQQMLAIGRGLMARPKLLLLDEPSLGLAPLLVAEIFALIAGLRDRGLSILLAEQNARMSLAIADRGYVIENGRVVLSGTGRELLASASVAERYLGIGEAMRDDPGARRQEMAARLRAALAG